jgi:hypothetical protein
MAFKLSLWTLRTPPGHSRQVGAPAKVHPALDPPRVHAFGTLPTPIGRTPILVRVFKPTDIPSLIWLKNNSPVWGNPLYEPTVLLY